MCDFLSGNLINIDHRTKNVGMQKARNFIISQLVKDTFENLNTIRKPEKCVRFLFYALLAFDLYIFFLYQPTVVLRSRIKKIMVIR